MLHLHFASEAAVGFAGPQVSGPPSSEREPTWSGGFSGSRGKSIEQGVEAGKILRLLRLDIFLC